MLAGLESRGGDSSQAVVRSQDILTDRSDSPSPAVLTDRSYNVLHQDNLINHKDKTTTATDTVKKKGSHSERKEEKVKKEYEYEEDLSDENDIDENDESDDGDKPEYYYYYYYNYDDSGIDISHELAVTHEPLPSPSYLRDSKANSR